jgi:hypothetical protein
MIPQRLPGFFGVQFELLRAVNAPLGECLAHGRCGLKRHRRISPVKRRSGPGITSAQCTNPLSNRVHCKFLRRGYLDT